MTARRLPRWHEVKPLIGAENPFKNRRARALSRAASIWDLRALAQRHTPSAVFDYTDGAAGDELALKRAREVFSRIEFAPRVLRDVSNLDTSTEILGASSALPIVLAPTGFTRMMHYEGEPAVAAVAARVGIPYSLSTLGTTSIEDLANAVPNVRRWFQLYLMRDRSPSLELLERATAAGYETLILTVDAPVAGIRRRDVRNGLTIPPKLSLSTLANMSRYPAWWFNVLTTDPLEFATFRSSEGTVADLMNRVFDPSLTAADVEWARASWAGKIVVKGVQSVQDAQLVADLGVDAIVLSNHGGRQLDKAPVPLEQLPLVKATVGENLSIFIDGGVMSGSDVVAAVALGADAVLIGRAYLYGLMAGGQAGVQRAVDILQQEIGTTMSLLGARSINELTPDCVRFRAPR
ncbi:MAG: alpha-hydroxy-acid oxidizing protein [Candidatus Nanopelagicales bacterium]|nr:alpha-hydroxy-acid oxidizing protein [Candidatus Nanopelagicales bacterium]